MIKNIVILPEAKEDIAEARIWYENRSAGLGDRFLECVNECLDRVREHPELCERAYRDYRRASVPRFPYVVFYLHDTETVTVYSVFHTAQHPRKWRNRLE